LTERAIPISAESKEDLRSSTSHRFEWISQVKTAVDTISGSTAPTVRIDSPSGVTATAQRPDRFWRRFAVVVLAMIAIMAILVPIKYLTSVKAREEIASPQSQTASSQLVITAMQYEMRTREPGELDWGFNCFIPPDHLASGQFRALQQKFAMWDIPLPGDDKELVYAPFGTPEADAYLDDMALGANFATVNHLLINALVLEAFQEVIPAVKGSLVYFISHNIARKELLPDAHCGFAGEGWVHRKGATRAFPANHPSLKTRPSPRPVIQSCFRVILVPEV